MTECWNETHTCNWRALYECKRQRHSHKAFGVQTVDLIQLKTVWDLHSDTFEPLCMYYRLWISVLYENVMFMERAALKHHQVHAYNRARIRRPTPIAIFQLYCIHIFQIVLLFFLRSFHSLRVFFTLFIVAFAADDGLKIFFPILLLSSRPLYALVSTILYIF